MIGWQGREEQKVKASHRGGLGPEESGMLISLRRWIATRIAPELVEEADRDSLTGLNNRRADRRVVKRAMKQRGSEPGRMERLVRFRGDVDNLKALNDMCGHQTGDRALVLISRVLRNSVRDGEKVVSPARVGGDEFAFTLQLSTDSPPDRIRHRLERNVTAALKREGLSEAGGVEVGLSVGFAVAGDSMSLRDLDAKADRETRRRKSQVGRSLTRIQTGRHRRQRTS